MNRAETLDEGGELGRDEDGADDEGTADSFGCDYSHPVAAGVPRRWQWAVVPWVTNAWLSLPYGLGVLPQRRHPDFLRTVQFVRPGVARLRRGQDTAGVHRLTYRTRAGASAAGPPGHPRSHGEQVPFSRRISTVLASNKYRSRDE